jgi:hypothetical protein
MIYVSQTLPYDHKHYIALKNQTFFGSHYDYILHIYRPFYILKKPNIPYNQGLFWNGQRTLKDFVILKNIHNLLILLNLKVSIYIPTSKILISYTHFFLFNTYLSLNKRQMTLNFE